MPKKKPPKNFFQRAKDKGSEKTTDIVNGDEVKKELVDGTKKNYARQLELWNEYAQAHPNADPDDVTTSKDFARTIAYGIDGMDDDPKACIETVLNYYRTFTAARRRGKLPLSSDTTLCLRNFIKGPLQQELGLALTKRKRRYGTMNHFIHLGTQLWQKDWQLYKVPRIRVDTWASIQLYAFTSARVGEYIESTARAGSGRGLHYRDVTFGLFRNEQGRAEFAVQVVRDAKNMTWTPHKRPEHSVHEGLEPRPLFCNPILTMLARAIADGAFKDYETAEELLEIEPPDEEMYHLQFKEEILDKAFFDISTGTIQKANTFSKRLRDLGFRAGYARPPTVHDFRAEGLYVIDKLYSTAQRMKHGGQQDEATYRKYYQPNNSGTDGQNGYFNGTLRTLVNDRFRGMTISRNPDLWQSLPAEEQHELENTSEFMKIEEELEVLTQAGTADLAAKDRRKALNTQRRKLVSDAPRTYQKHQPSKLFSKTSGNDLGGRHRAMFSRIRHLMPERDRLASGLFVIAPIRSDEGRKVLHDMITLCRQGIEVVCRPGLEPGKCNCPAINTERKNDSKPAAERWRHIYSCYKKTLTTQHGFSELCFQCSEWVIGNEGWSIHCQEHLARPETIPTQCNLLVYGGALASPGYCPFCLGDPAIPAAVRMHQFLDRTKWREHIEKHVENISDDKGIECPHPRSQCAETFKSVQDLKFHLQDVHCIELIQRSKKRRSHDGLDAKPDRIKRSRGISKSNSERNSKSTRGLKIDHEFVDETAETLSKARRMSTTSLISSQDSISLDVWDLDKIRGATETPISSVESDSPNEIDPCLFNK